MSKPKVGFYWCASCGGCEEAVVDLHEEILGVAEAVEIVLWPVAMDFKRSDVEAMRDGTMAVAFINGAVRSGEQEEMAHLLRRKAGLVVAFGSCSHTGGIPGLANLWDRQAVLDVSYLEAPSVVNPEKTYPAPSLKVPEGTVTLPALFDAVKALDQTVEVDYYLPGCPPPVKLIAAAVGAILKGELPPKGSVLAPGKALCDTCPRKDSKPEKPLLKEFKRPHEMLADPEKCLLAQGLLCMGPSTRSGCDNACIQGNMPCTGCLGPTGRVMDQGAKALSGFASLLDHDDEEGIRKGLDGIVDPVGTFYRYALASSLLHRRYRN